MRGCSSSAKPFEDLDGVSEAGLRTLLPRAFAGSKEARRPSSPRNIRPPASPRHSR
jgi:hypothetical protein